MAGSFVFEAQVRSELGRGHSRRLRQVGKVPAVLYGGGADPVGLVFDHNKVLKALEPISVEQLGQRETHSFGEGVAGPHPGSGGVVDQLAVPVA